MHPILIVEDDLDIAEATNGVIVSLGYETVVVHDGESALRKAMTMNFELILLDLTLPRMDGKEVCQKLRQDGVKTPIIVLTARNSELDKVLLLELGADDYVGKPFSNMELGARIKAVLRRTHDSAQATVEEDAGSLKVGDLEIDLYSKKIFKTGEEIPFTAGEFSILEALAKQPGRPMDRMQLTEHLYGKETAGYQRAVTAYINRIRQKLEEDPANPKYLVTVRGFGYALQEPS